MARIAVPRTTKNQPGPASAIKCYAVATFGVTKFHFFHAGRPSWEVTMASSVDGVYASTLDILHRVAAHVLAHRRFDMSGRCGLRASPGGFATPAFGTDPEVIRISGVTLVREVGGTSAFAPISGSTLRDLAAFVGVDLDANFNCGEEIPPLGDADVPFDLDVEAATKIADWYSLGWNVLDAVLATLPIEAESATVQLWPEHFDAATTVELPSGKRVNLGFSPGDAFERDPYLYVGPWGSERGGDPEFWNAPFGAVLRWSQVYELPDPAVSCQEFIRVGLRHASGFEGAVT